MILVIDIRVLFFILKELIRSNNHLIFIAVIIISELKIKQNGTVDFGNKRKI